MKERGRRGQLFACHPLLEPPPAPRQGQQAFEFQLTNQESASKLWKNINVYIDAGIPLLHHVGLMKYTELATMFCGV